MSILTLKRYSLQELFVGLTKKHQTIYVHFTTEQQFNKQNTHFFPTRAGCRDNAKKGAPFTAVNGASMPCYYMTD